MAKATRSHFRNWISKLTALKKLLLCLGVAIIFSLIFYFDGIAVITAIMIGWDVFSLFMIFISWLIFFTHASGTTRELASTEDESRIAIFIIVLASVLVSLFGILILMNTTNRHLISKELHEPVSLLGVGLSWFLLHSIFTLHYTHLYYGDDRRLKDSKKAGLKFPDEPEPDYLDFAYFSFVIGMTFQVSDINITGRKIRRLALLHGIISFLFNTIIIALTISVIMNLKS